MYKIINYFKALEIIVWSINSNFNALKMESTVLFQCICIWKWRHLRSAHTNSKTKDQRSHNGGRFVCSCPWNALMRIMWHIIKSLSTKPHKWLCANKPQTGPVSHRMHRANMSSKVFGSMHDNVVLWSFIGLHQMQWAANGGGTCSMRGFIIQVQISCLSGGSPAP